MKMTAYIDMECWGIGIDVGKAQYSPFRYFASLQVLCFVVTVWFGKKVTAWNQLKTGKN